MLSPKQVTTTASEIAPFNPQRDTLFLQNTGTEDIYIKKQNPNGLPINPSATSYDYILWGRKKAAGDPGEGDKESYINIFEIKSCAAFRAVVLENATNVAVMETEKISTSGGCGVC